MWGGPDDWSEVRADLVIGSCPRDEGDLARLREEVGVSAVLSLQTDACRAAVGIDGAALGRRGEALGLRLVNTPLADFDPADQRLRLPEAVRSLHGLVAAGHRVYVHCTAGINRAPLVVLGYLCLVGGQPPAVALASILRARPRASPYWEALHGCRADLVARHAAAIAARARALAGGGDDGGDDTGFHRLHRRRAEEEVLREVLTAPW